MLELKWIKFFQALAMTVLFLLPIVAFSGKIVKVDSDKVFYRIALTFRGSQLPFSGSTSLEGSMAAMNPPRIWLWVFETTDAGRARWQYVTGPLGSGDDFVMQGHEYRVVVIHAQSINSDSFQEHDECFKGVVCYPAVDIIKLPRVVSSSGKDALVLSKHEQLSGRSAYISASIQSRYDKCTLNLYLNDVAKGGAGYVANINSILVAYPNPSDISVCHDKVDTGRIEVSNGEVVNFGDFGRFKVESIWPAEPNHSVWVILVPADKGMGK